MKRSLGARVLFFATIACTALCLRCDSQPKALGLKWEDREANASEATRDKLGTVLSCEFEDVHLIEVTRFLSDQTGVAIQLDGEVIAVPGKPAPAEAVTDGMLPFVRHQGVPLRVILQGLVTPLGLDYLVVEDRVAISTTARCEAFLAGE
jgi:hypothetical protein